MPKRPRFALKVNDLASSLTFYLDRLGFQLVRYVLLKFASEVGEGHKITVRQLLGEMNWYLADHCREIRETGCIHRR